MRCMVTVSRRTTPLGFLRKQAMATVRTASWTRADEPTGHGSERSALERVFDLDVVDKMTFRGHTPWYPFAATTTFGGQAVGQALMAAGLTLEGDHKEKMANSVHAYFVLPGDLKKAIIYKVEVIRDGKNFSTRRVEASQDGVVFCTCMMSFQHHVDSAMTHQTDMPEGVPPPEDLHGYLKTASPEAAARYRAFPQPELDIRQTTDLNNPVKEATAVATEAGDGRPWMNWVRVKHGVRSDSPLLHQCMLAYLSDLRISSTALRRHPSMRRGALYTSLDHSIWFQGAAVKPDDWLLFVLESPVAGGGRGFNDGRMYSRDGRLVLNVAQEGAYRVSKL